MLRSFCDGTVFADRIGADRPSVVALHGWGRDRSDLAACVAGYDALSIDLPGFGASPPPTQAWGGSDYAAQMSRVIAEATDEPVVLVGHSFGGRVATCLAAAHPDQVAGLLLTGVPLLRPKSSAGPARAPAGYRLIKRLHRLHLVSDDRLEQAKRTHGSADYRNATGVMRDVLVRSVNETYADELAQLSGPVELVWGSDDTAAPRSVAEQAQAILEQAGASVHLTEVAGGHDTPIRQPQALRAGLDRLLLEHSR
jgi:pimeloyl-ACP methyl ester carboxylesterase